MMTSQLSVPFFPDLHCSSSLELVSSFLGKTERHALSFTPWAGYDYKPRVHFHIAHGIGVIFLSFHVEEPIVRAAHSTINSDVYQDSCVEFFVGFGEGGYYNFEFNCTGTFLGGYGKGRDTRQRMPVEVLAPIRTQSVITRNAPGQDIQWSLTVALPLEVLMFHQFSSLRGVAARGNFYKCGDDLPRPHYVTWANIEAPEPDFHLPAFFGELRFE